MRTIRYNDIVRAVKQLCIRTNVELPSDVQNTLLHCLDQEAEPLAQGVLDQILRNARLAASTQLPLCQDTGVAVFFLEVGQDASIDGGLLTDAINEGVRQGYHDGFLRKSIVRDPFDRVNTGDNTPAIIHTALVPGENLRIVFCPKGGGSENMSRIGMLKPADGWEGVSEFVVETVRIADANPCPPVIVGVGIGGTFDLAPILAKRALLRSLDDENPDPVYAEKESQLLREINCLHIGPAGFGGKTTALGVKINVHPCHIASLPVAVNIQCHSARHGEVIL